VVEVWILSTTLCQPHSCFKRPHGALASPPSNAQVLGPWALASCRLSRQQASADNTTLRVGWHASVAVGVSHSRPTAIISPQRHAYMSGCTGARADTVPCDVNSMLRDTGSCIVGLDTPSFNQSSQPCASSGTATLRVRQPHHPNTPSEQQLLCGMADMLRAGPCQGL